MRAILLGTLTALTITTVHAAEKDVNSVEYMLPHCRLALNEMVNSRIATTDHESISFGGICAGMVQAISSMLYTLKGYSDRDLVQIGGTTFCTTTPVLSPVEGIRVVLKYADLHPENKGDLFFVLVMNAMRDAFPCKK
jgi:hypothetical protein